MFVPVFADAGVTPIQSASPKPGQQDLMSQFQTFVISVYTPYCTLHKGLKHIQLQPSGVAYPATVTCVDNTVVTVKAP
jgi:hypothetical protein